MKAKEFGLVTLFVGLWVLPVLADDSAAAIAAGGLVSRRETRIVMAKEVLKISPTKVTVDYDFRNDTDENVTTEVAFPIPPYEDGPDERSASLQSFSDLQLTIDGRPAKYRIEAKALLKQRDVTAILQSDHIDIAEFGKFDWNGNKAPEFDRLSVKEQKRLIGMGLIEPDEHWGMWTVHLQYHWTQTFPAHSSTHIRHQYTPVEGFTQVWLPAVEAVLKGQRSGERAEEMQTLRSFCAGQPFLTTLVRTLTPDQAAAKTEDEEFWSGVSYPHWVDFILTSANTWRRPIEDFELIVERGQPLVAGRKQLVSFCAPGPVEKLDAGHFRVHVTNLIPSSELHIGFFDVPMGPKKSR